MKPENWLNFIALVLTATFMFNIFAYWWFP